MLRLPAPATSQSISRGASSRRAISKTFKIGLLLSERAEYGRGVLRGIANFAKDHSSWQFKVEPPTLAGLRLLAAWKPDGLIVMVNQEHLAPDLIALGIPFVNVCKMPGSVDLLRVQSDDEAVGRLGAEHLLQRRAVSYGFVEWAEGEYADIRKNGFIETIRAAGRSCMACLRLPANPDEPDKARLADWLGSAVKPLAVMASNDVCGRLVLETCREMNLSVPDEVAVLGVDNDDPISRLVWPGLSSIALATEQIGSGAARLLGRRLVGKSQCPAFLRIAPLGVVARGSTQQVPVSDPLLARAMAAIYEGSVLSVDDLLDVVPLSRASLERRFRQYLNRTPLQEIRRIRVAHVRQLLTATDLPLKDIASRCGYSSASRLIESFQQEAGQGPSSYRRQIAQERKPAAGEGKA